MDHRHSFVARLGLAAALTLATSCVVDVEPNEKLDEESTDDLGVIAAEPSAVLVSGTPVSGLGATKGAQLRYNLTVPAGATNLRFQLSGGSGDADLYVRFNAEPTRTVWDYRPYLDGNNETVTPSPIQTGVYHVMLRAYSTFSGATLVASFDPPVDPGTPDAGTPDPGTPDAGTPTGPDCHVASSWPADWVAFEDQVLTLVNARRAAGATCGGVVKPPAGALTHDAALRVASRCHSQDMAVHGYFAHNSQDGRTPWQRIDDAGYTANATGENIAAGYGTAQAVVDGWMTSTGHCNGIMNGNSNEIGIGYAYQQGSPYGAYWTQDFGHR